MRALIVSRTKMGGSDRCIGALAVDNQPLRLLNEGGGHQNTASPFQIGQIWELAWTRPADVVRPHVEDVSVTRSNLLHTQSDLLAHLLGRIQPWEGGLEHLFDGLLGFTAKGNGYIGRRIGLPGRSTGFWLPDRNLLLRDDGKHFDYRSEVGVIRGLAYVGEMVALKVIPAGTLVRVSLARWWRPSDAPDAEERCYLQLSGWYQ